jgi:chondroitin-sulfate-ABC endolyase/exolyase
MTTSPLSRRGFLATSAALGAAATVPLAAAGAAPPTPAAPADLSDLESELASLDKPIYLLESAVPENFTTEAGELSISHEHAKLGLHSLRWESSPAGRLLVDTPLHYEEVPVPGQVAYFATWLYNEQPVEDVLRIEFGRGDIVDTSVDVHLNFRGWRTCWIRYAADTVGTPHPNMDRITLVAPEGGVTLWVDLLVTNASLRADRPVPDFQVPTAGTEVLDSNNYHWMGLLDYWQKRQDPGFDAGPISAAEVADAQAVHEGLLRRQRSGQSFDDAALAALEAAYDDAGIPALEDPSASGEDLRPADVGAFLNDKQLEIIPASYRPALQQFGAVSPLRATWENCGLPASQAWANAAEAGDESAAERAGELVLRIFTHLQDQGWALGSGQGTIHHIGYTYRAWAQSVLMVEPLLRERGIWQREMSTLEWFAGVGRLTHDFTQNRHRSGLMDVLNTLLEGLLTTCFAPDEWEDRARRLRTFRKWNDYAFTYSPGISSGFKPDGAMYHHVGPYPLYGRDALGGAVPPLLDCAGTVFALGAAGQKVLAQALRHQVLIANTLDYPLSQSGRQQTGTQNIRKLVNTHALLGRTRFDGSGGLDLEHASMFRRLIPAENPSSWQERMDQQFAEAGVESAAAPQGVWALPYGATALSRHGDRLVSVRGHNRYLWSTEIYDQNNVYGRYQTYGQLSILGDVDGDGWVTASENGDAHPGYDWNFVPGTTTKTLPFDELKVTLDGTFESMPMSESRFGGPGVLSGHASVYGMELREHPSFDPTHTARITTLLVGDRVIALGSGIRNEDPTHPTRTTLFQQCPQAMPGAREIVAGDDWVTDHAGNGYVRLSGPDFTHRTGEQTTPDQSGNEWGTRVVSLGYLDHGTAPADGAYGYVVLTGTDADTTASFAGSLAEERPPVVVHQHDRTAHVVTDTASDVTAHVVFESDTPLSAGVVRSLDTQGIVLTRPTGDGRTTTFSVTDPDLRFYEGRDEDQYASDGTYVGGEGPYSRPWRYSESIPSQITMVLDGNWRIRGSGRRQGIELDTSASPRTTTVIVQSQHGASIEFALMRVGRPTND